MKLDRQKKNGFLFHLRVIDEVHKRVAPRVKQDEEGRYSMRITDNISIEQTILPIEPVQLGRTLHDGRENTEGQPGNGVERGHRGELHRVSVIG